MKNIVMIGTIIITALCCCPFFDFGVSSNPIEDFEAIVYSPMPPGITPIAADYENIGFGDGYRAVHFRAESSDLMDKIIEKYNLTKETAIFYFKDAQYPLEKWQTNPKADEIEHFEYTEYEKDSGVARYSIELYLNKDHTEGVFKIIYY